ncbi:MAG TPA: glycosyltransferase family 2 protein [Acidiferrobacteraceae bacterium]|nr:glycosyltransferase family 2 protein [Acidiferrobacteraceae bacterium]
MRTLSIVIPAYNEEASIGALLEKIDQVELQSIGVNKEVIVVDDCSSDRTGEIVKQHKNVSYYLQPENHGKGSAVKRGISASTGDWVLVQDADLEYEPNDYIPMIEEANHDPEHISIYGSRLLGQIVFSPEGKRIKSKHKDQKFVNWLANRLLTVFAFMLFGKWITDTLTAYKLYPGKLVRSYNIVTSGFETDHELTAFLIRSNINIKEVPIHYYPRSVEDGKKIKTTDFFIALITFLRFRFRRLS